MDYAIHGSTLTGVGVVFQLLFKVEGQGVTNQRTEPHKSLISKNVSLGSYIFLSVKVYILVCTKNDCSSPDFKDKAEDAEGGLGVLQAEEIHRRAGKTESRSPWAKTRLVFALESR